jgi:molybdopterin converting factor small subunit
MSAVTVNIPAPLREFTGGAGEIRLDAATVDAALRAIELSHPGFLGRVLTPEGTLRPHVNVFVNADSVKALDGLATRLPAGASVLIVPAVAGG